MALTAENVYATLNRTIQGVATGFKDAHMIDDTTMQVEFNDGTTVAVAFPRPKDGVSIVGAAWNESNHLILTLSDGTEVDSGKPELPGEGDAGVDEIYVNEILQPVVNGAVHLTIPSTQGFAMQDWVEGQLDNYLTVEQSKLLSTKEEVTTELKKYVTVEESGKFAEKTQLENYLTKTEADGLAEKMWVQTQLNSYVTKETADGFVTKTELEDYSTEEETQAWVTEQLAGYVTTVTGETFATKEYLTGQLEDYVTTEDAGKYAEQTWVTTQLEDYVTQEAAGGYAVKTEVTQQISDLSDQAQETYVKKETGKTLTSNDFTTELKEKLDALENYDDSELAGRVTANENAIETLNGSGVGSVTKTVADKIAEIVANAPDNLNTLKEISDWIIEHQGDVTEMNSKITSNTEATQTNAKAIEDNKTNIDKNTAAIEKNTSDIQENKTAISGNTSSISTNAAAIQENKTAITKNAKDIETIKAEQATQTWVGEQLEGYVQKEDGKGLSEKDFTTAYEAKLNSLENYNDTEIQGKVKANSTDIEELQTDVNSLKPSVSSLQEDMIQAKLDISGLQTETADIKSKLVTHTTVTATSGTVSVTRTAENQTIRIFGEGIQATITNKKYLGLNTANMEVSYNSENENEYELTVPAGTVLTLISTKPFTATAGGE